MIELNSQEVEVVSGGSVLGVLCYGTIGFWVGGIAGFFAGIWPAVPGSVLGMTIGAYLGTDGQPQVIIIQDQAAKNIR